MRELIRLIKEALQAYIDRAKADTEYSVFINERNRESLDKMNKLSAEAEKLMELRAKPIVFPGNKREH